MYLTNTGCLWILLIFMLLGGGRLLPGLIVFFFPILIIFLLLGFIGSSILKNFAINHFERTKTDQQKLFVHLLTGVLVHIAKADGPLTASEVATIRLFFQKRLGYRGDRLLWIKELLKSWANSNRSIESLCEEINVHFTLDAKLVLIQLAHDVAEADGVFSQQEKKLIEKVVHLLGITDFFNKSMGSHIRQKSQEEYFQVLGLNPGASQEEIKKAYRELVRQYHPDKVRHLGEEFQKTADEKIRDINEAYEKLTKNK